MDKAKRWLDFQPGIFTLLGLEVNSLLDKGEYLSLDEVHKMCDDYSIIEWLSNKGFQTMGFWDDETKIIMAEEFCAISNSVDEERKLYVHNNGIALLIALSLFRILLLEQEVTVNMPKMSCEKKG